MKKPKDKPVPTVQSGLFISENKGQTAKPKCPAANLTSPPMADATDANSQIEDTLPTVQDNDFFPIAIPLINRRKQGKA